MKFSNTKSRKVSALLTAVGSFVFLFAMYGKFNAEDGFRTGFYLLTRGLPHADVIRLVQDSFRFMADYTGDIPGASEVECGNCREQDLPGANREARAMLPVLAEWTEARLQYEA